MIAIGSDHGGFELKQKIIEHLSGKEIEVFDCGAFSTDSVDYPDIAKEVCLSILGNKQRFGILICGTGIGISIAANKIKGIRAALCHNEYDAKMARAHNDANVLCLGGRVIGPGMAIEIVDAFLAEKHLGGRHKRRVDKITRLEDL